MGQYDWPIKRSTESTLIAKRRSFTGQTNPSLPKETEGWQLRCGNDPSAGSPTETLLRLHLPLNDEV